MPRYIDVDEEIREINEVIFEKERDGKAEKFATYCFRRFADALSKAPTADVQEVKHGEWIIEQLENEKTVCYCSRCGSGLQNRETRKYIDISGANYCPNCGAKMDVKDEEDVNQI